MTFSLRLAATLLAAAALGAAESAPLRVPVSVPLPGKGLASVALYDRDGVLVRTLLSAAPVDSGRREIIWDGTDDLGRPVPVGSYTPKGVFFSEPPSLTWVMKVGKSGNPPWSTADGKGNWGGNLGFPASIASNGTDVVMVQG